MSDLRTRMADRFREIARDRLESINGMLVALQGAPDDTEQAVRLKREVHTLKGEARMTGFKAISDVSHKIEELLEGVGEVTIEPVRVDAVFAGLDLIEALVQRNPDVPEDDPLLSSWTERAMEALGQVTGTPEAPIVSELPPAPQPKPGPVSAGGTTGSPAAVKTSTPQPAPSAQPVPAASRRGGAVHLRVSLDKLDQVTRLSGDLSLDHVRGERALDGMVRLVTASGRELRAAQTALVRLGRPNEASIEALIGTLEELRSQVDALRAGQSELQQLVQRADDHDFDLGLKLLELDERVRELRFLPLASLFGRFPRAVHDIAREQAKEVRLLVEGDAVELDKQVLDRIAEPLLHLVRNAVDHGIESPEVRVAAGKPRGATVRLRARTLGSAVEIQVQDDGAGIDVDQVRARAVRSGSLTEAQAAVASDEIVLDRLFDVGMSTRDQVSEFSGRGVGLAVVKDTVEQLGGTVVIRTAPGRGTTFEIRVPTSVVLARVLFVRAGGRPYALPVDLVRATRHAHPDAFAQVGDARVYREGDLVLPAVDLHAVLGVARPAVDVPRIPVVIVEHRSRAWAVEVGGFGGQHQAVQRPLDPFVSGLSLYHGVVGTQDGDIALLLSVPDVVRTGRSGERAPEAQPAQESSRARVLVVDDSEFTRDLVVQVLRDMDLDVSEAVNGRQGLDRFRESPPDLVLTDLDMPVLDGFGLLREIRSRPDGISLPVIVFSTRGSPEDRERAASLGADAYVVKTEFREAALRELVHRFLDRE